MEIYSLNTEPCKCINCHGPYLTTEINYPARPAFKNGAVVKSIRATLAAIRQAGSAARIATTIGAIDIPPIITPQVEDQIMREIALITNTKQDHPGRGN